MTARCPEGHLTRSTDFCDVCGEPVRDQPGPTRLSQSRRVMGNRRAAQQGDQPVPRLNALGRPAVRPAAPEERPEARPHQRPQEWLQGAPAHPQRAGQAQRPAPPDRQPKRPVEPPQRPAPPEWPGQKSPQVRQPRPPEYPRQRSEPPFQQPDEDDRGVEGFRDDEGPGPAQREGTTRQPPPALQSAPAVAEPDHEVAYHEADYEDADYEDADYDDADYDDDVDGEGHGGPAEAAIEWVLDVWIDPEWYASQHGDEGCPPEGLVDVVPVVGDVMLIGRHSKSRGIVPDIDCGPDHGASRRHAQVSTDGERWWVQDVGSANGTFVSFGRQPLPTQRIPAERPIEIHPGDRIYLGAWTRIIVRPAEEADLQAFMQDQHEDEPDPFPRQGGYAG